jgi:GntR family transcriptional regulator, rspAB operon transcriptional repressor
MKRTTEPTPQTATEAAYAAIIDLILAHDLRPGERTSVIQLSEKLAIGRTPIKEAITRLEAEGVLSVAGRSGTTVKEIDAQRARHLFDLRKVLEQHAAESAAKNVLPHHVKQLKVLLEEMRASSIKPADPHQASSRFIKANVRFHAIIIAAASNPVLDRLYAQLQMQVQIVTYLFHRGQDAGAARARHDEHVAIVQALEAKDGARLKRLLREHADTSEKAILRALAQRDQMRVDRLAPEARERRSA